jgi:hypothetical protein
MSMSDDELREIRARLEAATPGPWRPMIEGRDNQSGSSFIMVGDGETREEDINVTRDTHMVSDADLEFIAHARQDVSRLLDEVKRLKDPS